MSRSRTPRRRSAVEREIMDNAELKVVARSEAALKEAVALARRICNPTHWSSGTKGAIVLHNGSEGKEGNCHQLPPGVPLHSVISAALEAAEPVDKNPMSGGDNGSAVKGFCLTADDKKIHACPVWAIIHK